MSKKLKILEIKDGIKSGNFKIIDEAKLTSNGLELNKMFKQHASKYILLAVDEKTFKKLIDEK